MSPMEALRHAARGLRRRPGFTALAVGLVGLGIGAVTAAWTVLDRSVLQPLPVDDQHGVVVAWIDHVARGFDHFPVTVPLFEELEGGGAPGLAGVAAVSSSGAGRGIVEGDEGPWTVSWSRVLGDFFGVLGTDAEVGRTLRLDDDVPAPAERAVVISHGLWTRRFGRSPDIVGTTLRTRLGTYVVVGVMPAAFDYPRGTEVWAPTRPAYPEWDAERPFLELDLIARLAPGVGPATAADQLAAASRATPDLAGLYEGSAPVIRSFETVLLGDLGPTLVVLFLGALLVLGVAGLDLGNVALVRAVDDARALSVRRALGADGRRLLGEAAAEAGVLAVLAVGAGLALGAVAVSVLLPLAPSELPRLHQVEGLTAGAVILALAVGVVVVGTAVVLPRWIALRRDPAVVVRSTRTTTSRGGDRVREGLVVAQIALTVWVLASGALLVRTAHNLQRLDPGFAPEALSVVALTYDEGGVLAPPGSADLLRAAAAEMARHPGIVGATPVQMPPLPGAGAWQTILNKEGQTPEEAGDENVYVFMEFVESSYFDLLGAPVLRGRALTEADRVGAAPVVVVNEATARRYWPGEEAVGQRITTGLPGVEGTSMTVVGVVGDTRYGALTELQPTAYFPLAQVDGFRSQYLLVRTAAGAPPLLEAAREALAAEAPGVRAMAVERVAERLAAPLAGPRFSALLSTVLAVTALIIAVAGVYAMMAFLVRSRRREIGVRLACGGTPSSVGGRVIARGLTLAAVGSAIGAAGAAWSGRAFESLLFGVSGVDPGSLGAGMALALAAAALACIIPARRAAGVDPVEVLRAE